MVVILNRGRQWIQHGDNVITLPVTQFSTIYGAKITIQLALMGGVTTRGPYHNANPMTVTDKVDTTTRLLVRLHGGYGFTTCGSTTAVVGGIVGTTERFDDIANTQTARTVATPRWCLTGFSLNGFGFSSGGQIAGPANSGITERFDDVINAHINRTATTARYGLVGYTINGYGFTSCGFTPSVGTTERFDDVANNWTSRTDATARTSTPTGFGLNNFGFSVAGALTVQRFDDVANTQTGRLSVPAGTRNLAGYSLNGYGFMSCGYSGGNVGTTNRFDDIANTWTARTAATARSYVRGYSLNGFGFTSGGYIAAVTGTTERFDDIANTHTARTVLNTARLELGTYSTNEYFVNYFTTEPSRVDC